MTGADGSLAAETLAACGLQVGIAIAASGVLASARATTAGKAADASSGKSGSVVCPSPQSSSAIEVDHRLDFVEAR